MKKPWFFLGSVVVLLVLSTTIFSFYQIKQMEKRLGVILPAPKALALTPTPAKIMPSAQIAQPLRKLVPDRPQDYGIVVLDKITEPKTQEEWDNLIRQESQKAKAGASQASKRKPKLDFQQIQQRLARIDPQIQAGKAQLEKDPANKDLQAQLKHLMILRSLVKELEYKN